MKCNDEGLHPHSDMLVAVKSESPEHSPPVTGIVNEYLICNVKNPFVFSSAMIYSLFFNFTCRKLYDRFLRTLPGNKLLLPPDYFAGRVGSVNLGPLSLLLCVSIIPACQGEYAHESKEFQYYNFID
jgi:hypothetical protein